MFRYNISALRLRGYKIMTSMFLAINRVPIRVYFLKLMS